MSFRDQKNYFEKLKRYERKFTREESEMYKMFVKRHKDDEDLDKLSLAKLKELYEKYYVNREKKSLDSLFKPKDENS